MGNLGRLTPLALYNSLLPGGSVPETADFMTKGTHPRTTILIGKKGWKVDIRDLRYFLSMSDAGSLSEAAKKLGVAATTLSRQSYRMERELGAKLLIRKRGSIELTLAGKIMRSHARNILNYISVASDAVSRAGKDAV